MPLNTFLPDPFLHSIPWSVEQNHQTGYEYDEQVEQIKNEGMMASSVAMYAICEAYYGRQPIVNEITSSHLR